VSVIEAGTPAPEFTLRQADGSDFTRENLLGQTTILVFYPFAFSPVCTDQLQIYEEAIADIRAHPAEMYGVSVDSPYAQTAFRDHLGVSIAQLSDFPSGEASKAFGAYFEPAKMSNRCLVIVGPDAVVQWSHQADSPGDLPGVNLIIDALAS
jgi:peroxiredoxin